MSFHSAQSFDFSTRVFLENEEIDLSTIFYGGFHEKDVEIIEDESSEKCKVFKPGEKPKREFVVKDDPIIVIGLGEENSLNIRYKCIKHHRTILES